MRHTSKRKTRRTIGIRGQLLWFLCFICLLLLLLFWFLSTRLLEPLYTTHIQKQLTAQADAIVEQLDKAIAEGRNPYELADGEYVTSCTEVCPNGAISFGDSKNPEHKVYELIRSPHAFRLLERLGTDPQVYYLSKREWVRRQGDNYLENEKTKG